MLYLRRWQGDLVSLGWQVSRCLLQASCCLLIRQPLWNTIFLFSSSSLEDACNLFRDFFPPHFPASDLTFLYSCILYFTNTLFERQILDRCVRMECCTTIERWVAVYCQYSCLSFSRSLSPSLSLSLSICQSSHQFNCISAIVVFLQLSLTPFSSFIFCYISPSPSRQSLYVYEAFPLLPLQLAPT